MCQNSSNLYLLRLPFYHLKTVLVIVCEQPRRIRTVRIAVHTASEMNAVMTIRMSVNIAVGIATDTAIEAAVVIGSYESEA